MDDSQRTHVARAVEQAMQSFEAAERALDAEGLIGHFAGGPDFYIYNDGHRLTYDAMTGAVRSAFPTLQSMEGGFSDVHVIVLSPDAALATARFQETMTARAGAVVRQRGVASWLWRNTNGRWRIWYGHVDHYSDDGSLGSTSSSP
jgi:ketosteroid isomerase-like protein